jgi:periplasmic protein TonB
MSETIQAQTVFAGTAPTQASSPYRLSDELAKLCLPQEFKDSYRTLAWVNSICALFLLVGLVGLKTPRVIVRPLSEVIDTVPVVWTPPEEQPKPTTEPQPDDTEPQPTDQPTEVPQVMPVVAAADPSAVAFAVPVPGAVAIAPMAHLATPPPPVVKAPPAKPTTFNPHAGTGGVFPDPMYPSMALRNHYEGTVIIEIIVEESGEISSAKVYKSSGFTVLDEAALSVVQNRWRFTPGLKRWLHWPCTFKLQ